MMSGFDANVPSRKPRTQIGRVLTELTTDSDGVGVQLEEELPADPTTTAIEPEPAGHGPLAARGLVAARPAPVRRADDDGVQPQIVARATAQSVPDPDVLPARTEPRERALRASEPEALPLRAESGQPDRSAATPIRDNAVSTTRAVTEASRLASGRERIAALRARLAAVARPPVEDTEPKRTAAAVREVVEDLRARLALAIQERTQLAETLEETRSALARAEAELERERKARVAAEQRADERGRIADEAVAEAEAIAAERDQVLAELAEQRRLDDEQAALLVEVEAALALRESERAAAARELEEARALADARAVELADMESRMAAEAAERARLEARCRDLESELARLTEALDALRAIEATVAPRH